MMKDDHQGNIGVYPPPTFKPEDYFIVVIPTLDGTGSMDLMTEIYTTAAKLVMDGKKKTVVVAVQDKLGVAGCMYMVCKRIGKRFSLEDKEPFRALLVGSDEKIENPEVLAEYIELADEKGYNIVCPIRLKGAMTSLKELLSAGTNIPLHTPDLAVVHPKGIGGVYYGTLYPGYPWHSDVTAEDAYFLAENPGIELRAAMRVRVGHYAKVCLWPEDTEEY
jgi:hypothetical protein